LYLGTWGNLQQANSNRATPHPQGPRKEKCNEGMPSSTENSHSPKNFFKNFSIWCRTLTNFPDLLGMEVMRSIKIVMPASAGLVFGCSVLGQISAEFLRGKRNGID
jgi:hypothetical protein